MHRLRIPISEHRIRSLHIGDLVTLSGVLVTARDRAHKYLVEQSTTEHSDEKATVDHLRGWFHEGVIYHCGPIVEQASSGRWKVVAAGPTTSARLEVYQDVVIDRFGLRAVIGKGGMGQRTQEALCRGGAVYLHALGGAASLMARSIVDVVDVIKPEFGGPEALWVLRVSELQLLVTMDAHGSSLHEQVYFDSARRLSELLNVGGLSPGSMLR